MMPDLDALDRPSPDGTTWEAAEEFYRNYISGPGEIAHRAIVALRGAVEERERLTKRLDELADLPDNWNSYGAPRITLEAIAAARGWLKGLNIWPGSNGGLMLGRDEDYEDLHIEPDGKFSARDDEPNEVLTAEVTALTEERDRLREALAALVKAVEEGPYVDGSALEGWLEPVFVVRDARAALAGAAHKENENAS